MIDKYTFCEDYEYAPVPIEGYEDLYTVDICGNVWSHKNQMYLKHWLSSKGYHCVTLSKNGVAKNVRIHRLVALAFIPNPHNYPEVGHDDDNKDNNHISNLYWTTSKENNNHNGKAQRMCKPIRCIETGEQWPSLTEAAKATGFAICTIWQSVNKGTKCDKYHYEYLT